MIQRNVYNVFHKNVPVRVRDSEPDAIRFIRRNVTEPTHALIKQNWRVHGVVMDHPRDQIINSDSRYGTRDSTG